MRKQQLGLSLGGLLMGSVVLIVVAMLGIKVAPSYIEFFAIKKAVNAVASEKGEGATVAQIRNAFDLRRSIDDFTSVTGADLEINKDANGVTIAATYRKEIPLVGNTGLYINFSAVSKE
jgi:uncharacterized protein DUF4845